MIEFASAWFSYVVLIGVLLLYWIAQGDRRDRLLKKIPGPSRLPFFGSALFFILKPASDQIWMLNQWGQAFNRRYTFNLGRRRFVVISNPEDLQVLMSSKVHTHKSEDYKIALPLLGYAIVTLGGDDWAKRRKAINPTFKMAGMLDFMPSFNDHSKNLVNYIHENGYCDNGKVVNMYQPLSRCVISIIFESILGINGKEDPEFLDFLLYAGHRFERLINKRLFNPLLRPWIIWKMMGYETQQNRDCGRIHAFVDKQIASRKKALLDKMQQASDNNANSIESLADLSIRGHSLTQHLLKIQYDNPGFLTDEDIRSELITVAIAGHDTTSSALSFILFCLACNPHIQNKVYEELYGIFGEDRNRDVTPEDFTEMKYFEACVKESLRLYPGGPVVARELYEDLILDDGTIVPKGVVAVINIFSLHRNADVFPEPEVFKPERFLPDENGEIPVRHPYAYIPFSAGPRNCVGQKFAWLEMKTVVANMLRNFKFIAAETRDDLRLLWHPSLTSEFGFKVTIETR